MSYRGLRYPLRVVECWPHVIDAPNGKTRRTGLVALTFDKDAALAMDKTLAAATRMAGRINMMIVDENTLDAPVV